MRLKLDENAAQTENNFRKIRKTFHSERGFSGLLSTHRCNLESVSDHHFGLLVIVGVLFSEHQ